jgi:hypothetical protein
MLWERTARKKLFQVVGFAISAVHFGSLPDLKNIVQHTEMSCLILTTRKMQVRGVALVWLIILRQQKIAQKDWYDHVHISREINVRRRLYRNDKQDVWSFKHPFRYEHGKTMVSRLRIASRRYTHQGLQANRRERYQAHNVACYQRRNLRGDSCG